MATEAYRETLPNSTLTEKTMFELEPNNNYSRIAIAMHSASTYTRITVYYVFEESQGDNTHKQIQEIDLTQNVLTILNLDMPPGIIRVTRNNVDSTACGGGALHVDANLTK